MTSETETNIVAVERITEYIKVENEVSKESIKEPKDKVHLQYSQGIFMTKVSFA